MSLNSIVTTNTYSYFFPKEYEFEIIRDNLLDQIKDTFKSNDLIFLKGKSGSGKTVLLKQLCQQNQCISIFIPQGNSSSQHLEIILESLIKQLTFTLKFEDPLADKESPGLDELKIMYIKLINKLRSQKASIGSVILVVDGLYHMDNEIDANFESIIREIIQPATKTIISIDEDKINLDRVKKMITTTSEELRMIGLNTNEVAEVFADLDVDIKEIRSMFSGTPSDIIEIRKLLSRDDSDISLSAREDGQGISKDIFELVWSVENNSNEELLKIISLIVFSDKPLSVDEISQLLKIEKNTVIELLESSVFFTLSSNIPTITNETYYERLKKKLEKFKKETYNLLVENIWETQAKSDYWLLAKYYEEAENYAAIIKLLDDQEYIDSVISTSSLSTLRYLVHIGMKGSKNINSFSNYFKFSLEYSIMRSQADSADVNEIEALMLLNKEEKAITIAKSSKVIEDRIHLLSIIARIQKFTRGMVEDNVMEDIKILYDQLNFKYIGKKSVAIASELITVDVDLAVKLLESSFDTKSDSNAIDKMMVGMTLDSLNKFSKNSNYGIFENIQEKVKDPELKDLFSTMFNFSRTISPKNIINQINNIDSLSAKISFITNWCEENDGQEYKIEIIKFALSLLTKSEDYNSNAGIYYKLSTQLLHASKEEYEGLVDLFDTRKELVKSNGPTLFYLKSQLNVIHCLDKFNKDDALDRIEELYDYSENIQDIATRLESIAYMISFINSSINKEFYEEELDIKDILFNELDEQLEEVTSNFAFQDEILSKSLRVLASTQYTYCKDKVDNVNTIINKEILFTSIISGLIDDGILSTKVTDITSKTIDRIIEISNLISFNENIYDESIHEMVKSMNNVVINKEKHVLKNKALEYKIFDSIKKINCARIRSISLSLFYSVLIKLGSEIELDKIEQAIFKSWNAIDIIPDKITLGYESLSYLAYDNNEFSTRFLETVQEEKIQKSQFTRKEFWDYVMLVKILIHAFSGISNENKEKTKENIEKIRTLIENIQSDGEQAIAYSLLSLAIKEDDDNLKNIIGEKIDALSEGDKPYISYVLRQCAPTLYDKSRPYLNTKIDSLSRLDKDRVYDNLCQYYLTGTHSYQPFDFSSTAKYSCTYDDMLEILEIIPKIENDSLKYGHLSLLLDIIKLNKGPNLNKERRSTLSHEAQKVINSSFNSGSFIKHNGYKILSQYHHKLAFDQFNIKIIEEFENDIEVIPNISDQIFCLTIIAAELKKPKFKGHVEKILSKVDKLIDKLTSNSEKISRLENIAEALSTRDREKEKYFLQKAISLLSNDNFDDKNSNEKRLIDLAYQIDPEFANSLVSSMTDNKNNNYLKSEQFNEQIRKLDISKKIINSKDELNISSRKDLINVSEACWESYAKLKSKSITPKKPEQLKEYIDIGSRLSINKSFPIFSWIIENIQHKNQKVLNENLFDSIYIGCRFALANKRYSEKSVLEIERYYSTNENEIFITNENPNDAITFISDKLSKTDYENIYVIDPFFDMEDLDFIFELYKLLDNDNIYFYILTGPERSGSAYEYDDKNEEEYSDYWHQNISQEEPPNISVTVASTSNKKSSPFHDRYIISDNIGFRLGGSINGIGKPKELSLSVLSEETNLDRKELYTSYINNNMFYLKRKKIDAFITTSFYLD